jgi:hypothetical protein
VRDWIDDIPEDRMTILFRATGSLSVQATFALRAVGHGNAVVLQQGRAGREVETACKP